MKEPALGAVAAGEAAIAPWRVLGALAVGVVIWLAVGGGVRDWELQVPAIGVTLVTAGVLLIPNIRRVVAELLGRIDHPSPRARAIAAGSIALLSAGYFILTAMQQGRYLHPAWHDEFSYATQIRMLASGRLWMSEHPLGEFFESFYLLTRGVYASIYFPGTAMLYAPGVWLHLPLWVMPALVAGGIVGLLYRIVCEMIDGAAAVLACLLALSLTVLRMLSVMVMSQTPLVLFGLLTVYAFLRWREQRRLAWAVAIGIFAGWAAVTRPLDAICFAAPVGVAMLWRLRGEWAGRWMGTMLLVVAGAGPFLAIQAVANHGIAGSWIRFPWSYYVDRDLPQSGIGFRSYDATRRPVSDLPQKQLFYARYIPSIVAEHQPARVPRAWFQRRMPMLFTSTLPETLLVILLPAGLLICGRRERWVLCAVLVLFVMLYALSPFFLVHYPTTAAPACILGVLLGAHALGLAWGRRREIIRPVVFGVVAVLAGFALPQARPDVRDQLFEPRLLRAVDEWEKSLPDEPAVVLFHFWPGRSIDQEPVYNIGVAWPDDARVVRAHDRGRENVRLYRYFAERQPRRVIYLFDEETCTARRLGTSSELAAQAVD